jgi:SPP1 gp7 family putative phage head morphogenesis protein
MADIYSIAEEYKARLAARERRAAGELLRAYALAFRRTRARIAEITDELEAMRSRGEVVSTSFLYERERLSRLSLEIEIEMRAFSKLAARRVTDEQRAAARLAQDEAHSLVRASGAGAVGAELRRLDREAVEAITGLAGDGSPLRDLFDAHAPRLAARASNEMVAGVAEGASARRIATRVREVMGGGLSRALTIARTETLRAYREVAHDTYDANASVRTGWVWSASLTGRTCPMCIVMHGRVFPLNRRLRSHPNCRCVVVPLTAGAARPETGAQWFARQAEGLQKSVLGAGKFEAFKAGSIQLSDLVGEREDERWGLVRFERSLQAASSNP